MISLSDVTLRVHLPAFAENPAMLRRSRWRMVQSGIVGAALGVAVSAAYSGSPIALEHSLMVLLRLMAVIKGALAIAAMVALDWRFAQPISKSVGLSYCVAVASMSGAVLPIWHATHLIEAAALFHGGLLLFLALAYVDRGSATEMLADFTSFRTAR